MRLGEVQGLYYIISLMLTPYNIKKVAEPRAISMPIRCLDDMFKFSINYQDFGQAHDQGQSI